jgi:hypothetical protein
MAVVAAQVFDTGFERVAVWPGLVHTDTGSPVDFSRFARVVVSATGDFDGEDVVIEANNILTDTPSYSQMVDVHGEDAELDADGFIDLGKWNNHFLRPSVTDAGVDQSTTITVVAVGVR